VEETNRKSWVALLVEVITSPGAAFKEIAERPGFWPAAITLTVINLIFSIITLPKLQEYSKLTLEKMIETVPPENVDILARTMSPESVTTTTVIAALVGPWVIWLVIALILKLFAAITAQEAPFRKMFAVAVYGYVPAIIGGIISSILVLNTAAENIKNVGLNLAVFSSAESGFLYHFLLACDPFTWWSLILLGIGATAVMKVKRPTGVLIYLFGLWLVFALITGAVGLLNVPA
jgi:hypothetical protein